MIRLVRWRALPWLVAFAVLVFLYSTLARHVYGGDSDVATLVLQGQSVVHGHLTLHGWWFLLDSFWTVEVPVYALGYGLIGMRPELLFLIPAVFAALVVFVAIHLAGKGQTRRGRWIAGAAVVALIGLPSNAWALLFLRTGWHVATTLYCLLAFACLCRTGPRSRWRWVVGVALLALGQVGDLQTVVIGTVPIGVAGLIAMARRRDWHAGIDQVAAAVVAPLAGLALRGVAVLVGTYQIGGANPHASKAEMIANVQRLPGWVDLAFGSGTRAKDTLGGSVLLANLRTVAAVVVAAAVLISVGMLLWGAATGANATRADATAADATRANATRADATAGTGADAAAVDDETWWRLDDVLVLAAAADLVFYVYATLANDRAYLRYLTPFVIIGGTLAARTVGRRAAAITWPTAPRRALAGLAAALTLLWAVGFGHDLNRRQPQLSGSPLITALRAHHLHMGLGYYWVANSTTVSSGGTVIIRPVQANRAQRIVRRDQLSADIWYGQPFQFLVLNWQAPFENVTRGTATLTFGTPSGMFRVGPYEVLTWDHPITVQP